MKETKHKNYSTELHKKLGITSNTIIRTINAPPDYLQLLGEIPEDVIFKDDIHSKKNIIHLFVKSMSVLEENLMALRDEILENGCIWISWYKKSSGITSDVTEDKIREMALLHELVDVKVCSVNELWSALKLVIPRHKRKSN